MENSKYKHLMDVSLRTTALELILVATINSLGENERNRFITLVKNAHNSSLNDAINSDITGEELDTLNALRDKIKQILSKGDINI